MEHRIATITLGAFLVSSAAAMAADAENGKLLAEENCARCHDVAPGGASKLYPSSFTAIAGYRAEEQIISRILYPTLHSPMPAWSNWISRDEVDDLVAFIQSLEGS